MDRLKKKVPSLHFEEQLRSHVVEMQRRLYGIRMKDLQHLAFDMAEKSQHPHPFNRDKKLARRNWGKAFLDRHGLSLGSLKQKYCAYCGL